MVVLDLIRAVMVVVPPTEGSGMEADTEVDITVLAGTMVAFLGTVMEALLLVVGQAMVAADRFSLAVVAATIKQ